LKTTTVFKKNIIAFNSGVRRIVNQGGTRSSKTYSILQLLLLIAQTSKGVSISVVSETLPHLKLGAIRDFESILKQENIYDEKKINKTDHVYFFGDSYIEFFAADQGKATGPSRNILYLNECNNIAYSIVSELEQRTDEVIIYDFNPTADFWISEKVFQLHSGNYTLIKSNYLDNEHLAPSIKHEIEIKAGADENYKKIHIDVEFGTYEGLIFPNINLVDAMPETDKQRFGMDFGFTNDPTTLIDVRFNNGEIWLDELLYRTAMTNGDIIRYLKSTEVGRKVIVADSAEPKSIEEIKRAGFNIEGCAKGPDSIRRRIDLMSEYKINVTKSSLNLIKEFRNYKWKIDKAGKSLNEPVDIWNHCLDASMYGFAQMMDIVKRSPPRILSQ
jgi:phage terminase large subunit